MRLLEQKYTKSANRTYTNFSKARDTNSLLPNGEGGGEGTPRTVLEIAQGQNAKKYRRMGWRNGLKRMRIMKYQR